MLKAAYRQEAVWLGVTTFPPLERTREDLLSCGNRFFGYVAAGELCGVIELEDSSDDGSRHTTIASLAVSPKRFRQGIGRALVAFVLDHCEGPVRVATGVGNEPAIRLYEALGFERAECFATADGVAMVALRATPSR